MRAIVDAKEFSNALDKVSTATQKSKYSSTLDRALIQFCNGRCVMTTTDFETWLKAEIPAQGDDFAFVFYWRANAVKACRRFSGELTMELTEIKEGRSLRHKLCMSCGNREGEFRASSPEEYPEMPELEPECSFTANAASLLGRIKRVKYATYKPEKDLRDMCTAVQFARNRIFCLDGHRAAWDNSESLSVPVPFMVPVMPMDCLALFGEQEVTIQLGKQYVDITDGTLRLLVRRLREDVYDLNNAIPEQFHEEIEFCPNEFLTELGYLRELTSNAQRAYVCFRGGRLLSKIDGYRYQTQIKLTGSSELEIGFNLQYLTDALRQFKGEPCVRMKLSTPHSPVLLEAEGRSDYALVLPIYLTHDMVT